MKYKENVIFRSASITKIEYSYLVELVKINNFKNILEFGPGASTYAFLENQCNIWSLEHHPEWFKKKNEDFIEEPLVNLFLYDKNKDIEIEGISDKKFDMAFIDGPPGSKSPSRMLSCQYASERTDIFLLHDCHRDAEKDTIDIFKKNGWKTFIIEKGRKIGVCYKKDSIIFP